MATFAKSTLPVWLIDIGPVRNGFASCGLSLTMVRENTAANRTLYKFRLAVKLSDALMSNGKLRRKRRSQPAAYVCLPPLPS